MGKAWKKIEYELPVFLILAFKLPYEQAGTNGVSFLAACLAAAVLLGQVIRRAGEQERLYTLFFAALLLSGDTMKAVFMPAFTFSYILLLKLVSFLCFLLAVLAVRISAPFSRKSVYAFAVPALCVPGILSNPGFVFFFLPVVLVLEAFEKYKTGKTGFDPAFLLTWLIPGLISGFYMARSLSGGKKMMGIIDLDFVFQILAWNELAKAAAAALPLILIFAFIWKDAYKTAAVKRLKRIILCCMLEPAFVAVCNIFLYYAVSDGWKYYIFTAVFTQFCLLFYFWNSREKTVAGAAVKTGRFIKKNPAVLLAAAVYLIKAADILYKR